ncbi:MAG: hypothetical protein JO162_05980 [Alphaproteobacteria bacterium]|nr:hypothetical protein [Alphaproteobacteria bacterium]MBV9016694.1 hypothetical protein [Alphaproteobacteria bacterium]MBV9152197.1 hypothetical protein [Alphaproteobacteria bacterium]
MQDVPAPPERTPDAAATTNAGERREIQRAIEHWKRNTWGADCIPLLDTFDFSPLRGDWGYWFLICGDYAFESAVFVTYGSGFAQLLGLPARPATNIPSLNQIPHPYRGMFSEGYSRASMASSPVTLDGTFRFQSRAELYRAVFMPIMLRPNWSKQLIFGSFNCREFGAI